MEKRKESETKFNLLPACVAEYIKLVIKKMRYRRKVQQDVQAELAAHFDDELKNCTTDEEKEQKAQQLITEFGDVKLLAVLLRRVKKRCRPLWRTIIARTFQAAGIIILSLILYVVWFFSGKPVVTIDYVAELNRMVRPVADENLNAAPFYKEAAIRYNSNGEFNNTPDNRRKGAPLGHQGQIDPVVGPAEKRPLSAVAALRDVVRIPRHNHSCDSRHTFTVSMPRSPVKR